MNQVHTIEDMHYEENFGNFGSFDFYLPDIDRCKVLFVYFHGGGLESGDKADDKAMLCQLASHGIAVANVNYRMYPEAKFPDYVQDAATAIAYIMKESKKYIQYEKIVVGGVSAGAYISLMIHFQPEYLKHCGVDESTIAGYVFDAGQPTTHFNVLRERGIDSTAVRVDEAAPIYYLTGQRSVSEEQKFFFLVSNRDIIGRREQNELLMKTMLTHGYHHSQIQYKVMKGFPHCGYVGQVDSKGNYIYVETLLEFLEQFMDDSMSI